MKKLWIAVADSGWRVVELHRLTRKKLERWLNGTGFGVKLLPAVHVRAYVKRALGNKLARICYALRDGEGYTGTATLLPKKIARTAYAVPT